MLVYEGRNAAQQKVLSQMFCDVMFRPEQTLKGLIAVATNAETEEIQDTRTEVEKAVAGSFYYVYGTDYRLSAIKSEARRALAAGAEQTRFFAQGLSLGLGNAEMQAADPREVLTALVKYEPKRD